VSSGRRTELAVVEEADSKPLPVTSETIERLSRGWPTADSHNNRHRAIACGTLNAVRVPTGIDEAAVRLLEGFGIEMALVCGPSLATSGELG
jgi:hypothetical protein